MSILKSLLPSLGIIAVFLSFPALGQSQAAAHRTTVSRSASLGGPVTPSQPNFFSKIQDSSVSKISEQPIKTINSGNSGNSGPLTLPAKRDPAPLVDDLHQSAGGFLKFDLK
jgi:hypothetical protein